MKLVAFSQTKTYSRKDPVSSLRLYGHDHNFKVGARCTFY
jgi:hypothetical protein